MTPRRFCPDDTSFGMLMDAYAKKVVDLEDLTGFAAFGVSVHGLLGWCLGASFLGPRGLRDSG